MSKQPPKSLQEAIERLHARNKQLSAFLGESETAVNRVANAPDSTLEDATERARKYWDKLEGRKSSIPPKARVGA